MSNYAIQVERLSKQYQLGSRPAQTLRGSIANWFKPSKDKIDFWALKDVSFTIEKGEAVGIIGRNGAGKSTLLKILSKITYPTHGKAVLDGRVSSLLEVGTGFHGELTGRENIFLNGSLLGMTREEIRSSFDEIIDFSGVEQFIDTPVKHYSSGMYVRLAFSVAAHLNTEILLVDEVLAVGDMEFQKKCLGKMGDVVQNGKTVLFVSHNFDAIERMCSKSILINNGQLQLFDETSKVIDVYSNRLKHPSISKKIVAGQLDVTSKNQELIFSSRQEVEILIDISSKNKTIYNGLVIHLGIQNRDNKRIGLMPLYNTFDFNFKKKNKYTICTKLENWPFISGEYSITVWISNGTEVLFWEENLMTFSFIEENRKVIEKNEFDVELKYNTSVV